MRRIWLFIKHRLLLAAVAAALIPLLVLVLLQFSWLARLEQTSAQAMAGVRLGFLEAVVTEIQFFHRSTAERLLTLPPSVFTDGRLKDVAREWDTLPMDGVRRLFLVDFTREAFGNFLAYDPQRRVLEPMPASEEAMAIIVASASWQIPGLGRAGGRPPGISADERRPPFRLVVNPITDESGTIVGVAGLVVDEEHFAKVLLPATIQRLVAAHFGSDLASSTVVTVRDDAGEVVFSTQPGAAGSDENTRRFSFVFTNWSIGLRSPDLAPQAWAQTTHRSNVITLGLLTLTLLGGLAMMFAAAHRATKLSQMKSDFVSNVSHELRTPLASIRVFAEFLRSGRVSSSEKVREYGEQIETESRRLTRLIDNILDFSRIESGRKVYEIAPGDLREVAAAAVETFRSRIRESDFRVLFDAQPDPFPPALLDADAIGQAVHNLLDNAVKYAGERREARVRVWSEGREVAVAVEDDGPGIPADEQRRVFERFHRVGEGLIHEVKGTGLGLAIVQHIVQAHRGRITLTSAPGYGSAFVLWLPRAESWE